MAVIHRRPGVAADTRVVGVRRRRGEVGMAPLGDAVGELPVAFGAPPTNG